MSVFCRPSGALKLSGRHPQLKLRAIFFRACGTEESFCDGVGLCRWWRRLFFRVLAVADERRAEHDKRDANPPDPRDAFVKKNHRRERREHEAQRGERPEKTDFAFRHQNQQADEEQRFEENAHQDLRIGHAGFDDADDFGGCHAMNVADARDALLQKNDAGGLEDEADNQNQKQLNHKSW